MPYININESEISTPSLFDVTENTVLIPILYVRKLELVPGSTELEYTETEVPAAKLYTSATEFNKDFSSGGGKNGQGARYIYYKDDESGIDKSYLMAYELLLSGLNVVIKPIKFDNKELWDSASFQTKITYNAALIKIANEVNDGLLKEFNDRNNFNIKFLTTGGYYNVKVPIGYDEVKQEIIYSNPCLELESIANSRQDCVALFEFKEFDNTDDFLTLLNDQNPGSGSIYSTAFFPWCLFNTTKQSNIIMPACFGYLMAYANSIQNNANWFAASGVNRGYIPKMIAPVVEVGEAFMHILQGDNTGNKLSCRVNPIMNAGSYGYRIWGNKVYYPTPVTENQYREYLNVRILLCDIKKQIYHSAMRTTFEPNDDLVWINFKSLCNSLLDTMKSGRGIKWYKWEKVKSDKYATITAKLWVTPIEAVESFDISVILTSEEVNVTE